MWRGRPVFTILLFKANVICCSNIRVINFILVILLQLYIMFILLFYFYAFVYFSLGLTPGILIE